MGRPNFHQKLNGTSQRTPKKIARAIRYSGLGVRSVGPVGDFLENWIIFATHIILDGFHHQIRSKYMGWKYELFEPASSNQKSLHCWVSRAISELHFSSLGRFYHHIQGHASHWCHAIFLGYIRGVMGGGWVESSFFTSSTPLFLVSV